MIITLHHLTKTFQADLSEPLDLSIPIKNGSSNPSCYWAEPVVFETITSGSFIGSVENGGSVNYQKLTLTPHGNGTHTECFGHIVADKSATIQHCLTIFHCLAEVVSITPEQTDGDWIIPKKCLEEKIVNRQVKALIIRTLPNKDEKKTRQYSGTNPPYLDVEAAAFLATLGIEHLLIDLPSIDREVDGGNLAAHKAFWRVPHSVRKQATITELIYVADTIPDGLYLLNLQIISLEMDASPSKPMLYKLTEVL